MMGADEEAVALHERTGDNLEAIHGIGPTFARSLNQAGIYQYAELAQFSPQQLAQVLTEKAGVRIAAERIEASNWIGQAEALAKRSATATAAQEKGAKMRVETEAVPAAASQPAWRQHAGFSLFFDSVTHESGQQEWKTRVYHEESGREIQFSTTDASTWVSWIVKRAQLPPTEAEPVERDEEEVVETARIDHPYNVKLRIQDVEVGPTDAADDRYQININFALVGPDARAVAAQRIPYTVEIQTVNLAAGTLVQFVESEKLQLEPDVLAYTVHHELPMPDAGRYELQTIVYVDSPAEMLAYHTGPTLNII
jgi:hypothetical protein